MLAPLRIIGALATEYAERAARTRRLGHQRNLVGSLLSRTRGVHWKSDFFSKSRTVSVARAEQVVDLVFYEKKAQREVKRQIDRLGGIHSSLFWDYYLRRAANAVLGFSDGYQSLLQFADQTFPPIGGIVDWNCGTGNIAVALVLASQQRRLLVVDSNPRAVVAAKRMAKHAFSKSPLIGKVSDPLDPELVVPHSEGAILMNALFLLESEKTKVDYLSAIGSHLGTDGILLLVEPKPELQKQSLLRLWVQRVVKGAALCHSPMNEFDLAIFVELQRRLFLHTDAAHSTTKQLLTLAKQAGFAVEKVQSALHGQYSVLVLRKLPEQQEEEFEPVIRHHLDPVEPSVSEEE